jgi:hypothetical protein
MDYIQPFIDSIRSFWLQLAALLPSVATAFVLMTIGWLVARLLRKITIRILRLFRIDLLAEKAGIEGFLLQGGVRYTTVTLIAHIFYWFILLTFALAVLKSMGLTNVSEMFNKMLLYVPNVIVAVLLLVFGSILAKFIYGASFTYLNNIGVSGAQIMSTVAQWAVLLFVVSATLDQLAIGGEILLSAFQIAFGALCLALALAFGLGGRDWASHILEKIWKR